jgi:hypothetical protein
MNAAEIAAKRQQERQWRAEEKREWDAELASMNAHRPDCICRAVQDWSPGPTCFQQIAILQAKEPTDD